MYNAAPHLRPGKAASCLLVVVLLCLLSACAGPVQQLKTESMEKASQSGEELTLGDHRAYTAYLRALDAERVGDLDAAESWLHKAIDYDPSAPTLHLWLGRVLAEKRDVGGATQATREALELDPDHLQANLQLAGLLKYTNQVGDAEKVYLKAVEIAPRNRDAFLKLGNLYRALGRANDGLRLLEEFHKNGGDPGYRMMLLNAALLKDLGRTDEAETMLLNLLDEFENNRQVQRALLELYLAESSLAEAATRLEAVAEAKPWQSWIPETLVQIYARLGDVEALNRHLEIAHASDPALGDDLRLEAVWELTSRELFDQARTLLQPLLARSSDNARASFYAGLLNFKTEDYDKALEMYGRIPMGSPFYAQAVQQRATVLQTMGKHDEAIALLEGYLDKEPDDDDMRYTLISAYSQARRLDEAMDLVDTLIDRNPDDAEAYVQKSFILEDMKRGPEAAALLRDALPKFSRNLRMHEALAMLLAETDQYPEAVEVLKQALAVRPDSISVRFSLGMYLDHLKRHDEAIAQMQKILELDENNADAMNFIGYTWAELGVRLPEAELLIKRALELEPNNGYITDSLGWVYYKVGKYEEAVKMLERAVELTSQEPIIVEHLGDAYVKISNKNKALQVYGRAASEIRKDESASKEDIERIVRKYERLNGELGQGGSSEAGK